jgi:hypothetical protein
MTLRRRAAGVALAVGFAAAGARAQGPPLPSRLAEFVRPFVVETIGEVPTSGSRRRSRVSITSG